MKRELIEIAILVLSQIIQFAFQRGRDRSDLKALRHRVHEAETQLRNMHIAYVPRREIDLALRGIEHTAKQTNAMVQAILLGGGNRDVTLEALKASGAETSTAINETIQALAVTIRACAETLDYTEICIAGVDGHGGLNRWEGRYSFMYLDNREVNGHPAPLVTVGVGCAIGLSEALTLPFEVDGRPAMQSEIARDFAALKLAPFDYVAGYYERFTRCRLPDHAIDDLMRKRFVAFVIALRSLFPAFDQWPETAKAGALDLIYGLGAAGLSAPHYPAFRQAGKESNFTAMAAECGSDTHDSAYDDRNEARKQLFLAAAEEAAKS